MSTYNVGYASSSNARSQTAARGTVKATPRITTDDVMQDWQLPEMLRPFVDGIQQGITLRPETHSDLDLSLSAVQFLKDFAQQIFSRLYCFDAEPYVPGAEILRPEYVANSWNLEPELAHVLSYLFLCRKVSMVCFLDAALFLLSDMEIRLKKRQQMLFYHLES